MNYLLGMAHKVCTEEGVWFKHPLSNLTWSNYTTCVDVEDLHVSLIYY
jgi:calcitonin receptor-like